MTRADEIATEFEGPFEGRSELHPGASPEREHAELPDGPSREDDGSTSTAEAEAPANGSVEPGTTRRVMSVDRAGSVDLDETDAVNGAGAPDSPPVPRGGAPGSQATAADRAADAKADTADQVVHSPQHDKLPQMARQAAGTWLKAAGWTAGTSLRVSNQLVRLASDPSSAQDVIDEVTKEVREVARDFLGVSELDHRVQEMAPLLSSGLLRSGGASPEGLRSQGEALLRQAADVGFDEGAHPAFARILTELSPDEARILRLLAIEGSQPMVDVRATNLIGNGSQLIAQSLNMLGPKAGLRQRDRVPVYLTNLARLSLLTLSDEPLERPAEYQVLEAQPEVIANLRDAIRAKTIRRSVHLTPFGLEFCTVCFPVNLPQLPPADI